MNFSFDIERFNENDPIQLRRVFDIYYKQLYSLAYGLTGDKQFSNGIVSNVFQRVWNQADKTFEAPENLRRYLLVITRNLSLDHIKKEKRRPTVYPGDWPENIEESRDEDMEIFMVRMDVYLIIYPLIQALPEPTGGIIKMLYIDELSVKQTAKVLRITEKKVRYHKKAGLAQLRAELPPEARNWLAFYILLSMMLNN